VLAADWPSSAAQRTVRRIAKRYTRFEQVLEDPDIDFVHINSPIPDHGWMSIEALKADAPIWKREVYATSPATTRRARESDADALPPPSATSAWKVNAECKHDTR
jgi:hypothetical protein